jgi:hypothetical protein
VFGWFRKYVRKIGILGVEIEFHPPTEAADPAASPGPPKSSESPIAPATLEAEAQTRLNSPSAVNRPADPVAERGCSLRRSVPMFDDWPADCHAIFEHLRRLLCQHGADFYPVGVARQVRVGWPSPHGGDRNQVLALLNWFADGSVELKLRVGRDSGLIGPGRPFEPSLDAERSNSERDYGRIRLTSAEFPAGMADWIAQAFRFAREYYRR